MKTSLGLISALLVAACQAGTAPDANAADIAGVWEPFSNGAAYLGAVTVEPARLDFAKAGVASIADKGGYIALDWGDSPSPEILFCGGEPPRTAQLQVQPGESSIRLEIAFFASAGKPAADRGNDLDLCAIQYWAR